MTNWELQDKSSCGVGFLVHQDQELSHQLLCDSLTMLHRLDHRGGRSYDGRSSDGVGILTNIPHELINKDMIDLYNYPLIRGDYYVAQIFTSFDNNDALMLSLNKLLSEDNIKFFWREVPVDSTVLGPTAKSTEPRCLQLVLIGESKLLGDEKFQYDLELVLAKGGASLISICNKSIVYKSLCLSNELGAYYLDLKSPNFKSSFAIVHQRFSTNTNPRWTLAQPFRKIAHNGEINTIKANYKNFIDQFSGKDKKRFTDIISMKMSDSCIFDRAFCHYTRTGRNSVKALSTMMPPAFKYSPSLSNGVKDYFSSVAEYKEGWEGPALIAYFNKDGIGAHNDRNGLRPSRYASLKNGYFYLSSEMGALDIDPSDILDDGRLSPGEFIHFDFSMNKIIRNNELITKLVEDYSTLKKSTIIDIGRTTEVVRNTKLYEVYYNYTREDLRKIILPMAKDGKEAISSMGTDSPLAIFSQFKQPLYNFFKQIFAQVTNPPIDAIRERHVTDLVRFLGKKVQLCENLNPREESTKIKLESPILSSKNWSWLLQQNKLKAIQLDTCFSKDLSLRQAIDKLSDQVVESVNAGFELILLNDRNLNEDKLIIPPLLAVGKISKVLSKESLRSKCSLIVSSAELKEVHHACCLLTYGADAIFPWMLYQQSDQLTELSKDQVETNIINAFDNGILKVMSKMGISTLNSYNNSENMEIVGLNKDLCDEFFPFTTSLLSGITLDDIDRNERRFFASMLNEEITCDGGIHWRKGKESRIHNPDSIHLLRQASFLKDRQDFDKYCENIDQIHSNGFSIRGLLEVVPQPKIDKSMVEDQNHILQRFSTGAMSLGSISKEAHETIADAMNTIGGKSNSGEGGEDNSRLNSDLNSKIKQVASGRFGVDLSYLASANEIQIKIAQGAKPGEGGQLPGHKVDKYIAKIRRSTPGVTLISPPPHHDIYSIEDLAQLIHDLKQVNALAKINVKLVSSYRVGTIACGVAKAGADIITISGYEGGTGASPLSSIKHAGLPFEIGLSLAHNELTKFGLRDKVKLETDGLLRTPKDIIKAVLMGADRWCLGSAALIPLGCIMMRKCHLNTCPVGIATQNPKLRQSFKGKKEYLINFLTLMSEKLREELAALGLRSIDEAVGRRDLLRASEITKDFSLDPSFLLETPKTLKKSGDIKTEIYPSLKLDVNHQNSIKVENIHRSVGTRLSYELETSKDVKSSILNFRGFAGQSFMAFGHESLEVNLEGYANDYFCKGLSGASVAVSCINKNPKQKTLVGNTAMYGATAGEVFIAGKAGERFAVRNSGAMAVVEGIGLHGLEYMTGGRVVILGEIGENFAAGMSGGYAYLWREFLVDESKINKELVYFSTDLDTEDKYIINTLLIKHYKRTKSNLALNAISNGIEGSFLKVIPYDYEKAMKKKINESLSFIPTTEIEEVSNDFA